MASDTFSSLLHLRLQATGNNYNDWINRFNSDVVLPLEQAICGPFNMFPLALHPVPNPATYGPGNVDGSSTIRILTVVNGAAETVWIQAQSPFVPNYWIICNLHTSGPVVFSIGAGATIDQTITIPAGLNVVFYDGSNPQTPASLWMLA